MSKQLTMRMARASDADRQAVLDFVSIVEAIAEYGAAEIDGHDWEPGDEQLGGWLREWFEKHGPSMNRVVWGFETLLQCTDPTLSHLDYRPDIKAACKAAGIEE